MPEENVADDGLVLTDSHRRTIGSSTGVMSDLIDELHRSGVSDELTADLERQIAALEQAAGTRARERGDVIGALAMELWVISCELRSKVLRGYGELGERESAFLDEHAAALEKSVRRLQADIAKKVG